MVNVNNDGSPSQLRFPLLMVLLGLWAGSSWAESADPAELSEAVTGAGDVTNLEKSAAAPNGYIQLDETVISGNQELPKVLYILPWREPEGLPQIDLETEFTELEVFRRLYPPAYRRELSYFETLEGSSSEE